MRLAKTKQASVRRDLALFLKFLISYPPRRVDTNSLIFFGKSGSSTEIKNHGAA